MVTNRTLAWTESRGDWANLRVCCKRRPCCTTTREFARSTYQDLRVTGDPLTADLRPCPFCANTKLTMARTGRGEQAAIRVVRPECGAAGPATSPDDSSDHA